MGGSGDKRDVLGSLILQNAITYLPAALVRVLVAAGTVAMG